MRALSDAQVWLLLALALALLPVAILLCWRLPAVIALGFVAILCLFSSSTWGQLQEENTLYARGTGLLHFSLINLLLWVACAAAAMRALAQPPLARAPAMSGTRAPFARFLAAFAFLLAGHLVLGLMADQHVLQVLGYGGVLNVLNLLLFACLLVTALPTIGDGRRLLLLVLALAALRAAFGLVRYVAFGGDSANPYRNFESLDIRLVYFDICDNYIAALAAFCLAWLLFMPGVRLSLPRRALLMVWLALEIATVALSFRRSSLVGMAAMFVVLFWQLPWQRRLLLGGLGAGAMAVAALTLMKERLQFSSSGTGLLSSLLYDVGPDRGTDVSRFYELEAAARSLEGNWLFGLGSWGSFKGNEDILDYHFGKFDFVHSGFGHLVLKSGLAGLALFIALLACVLLHYLRTRRHLQGNRALLADAGIAGLLFWMPTLLIGTPVIEFRTMLLLGLTLALPYLALAQRAPARRSTIVPATLPVMPHAAA